jgi:hypothetical protein
VRTARRIRSRRTASASRIRCCPMTSRRRTSRPRHATS